MRKSVAAIFLSCFLGLMLLATTLCAADVTTGLQNTSFPRPNELSPNIAFWRSIYTSHGVGDFVLHDRDNLGVVYAIVRVRETSNQARAADLAKPEVERLRTKYHDILMRLAANPPGESSTDDERRVAEMWGAATPDTLRRAADNIRVQQGLREKVDEGLRRAQHLLPQIVNILQKHNVPAELAALPMVESTFNPAAQSKAGAVGLWQFIRSTGKRYMTVTRKRDDRRDPIRATEAAAHLLKNNYAVLGSWPLAIVAYNHGHAGIQAASAAVGSKAIEDIVTRYSGPRFGFASKNFYAEFLAALDVVNPYLTSPGKLVGPKGRRRATEQVSVPASAPATIAPAVNTAPVPPAQPVGDATAPATPERSNEPVQVLDERPVETPRASQESSLRDQPAATEQAIAPPDAAPTPAVPSPAPAIATSGGDAAPAERVPADDQQVDPPETRAP